MKKAKKHRLCVFLLVLILCLSYVLSTYCQYSNNFSKNLKTDFWGTLRDYPIWEYYSKSPSWYTISGTPKELDWGQTIFHVRYLGDFRTPYHDGYLFMQYGEMYAGKYFKNKKLLAVYSKSDLSEKIFHGEITVLHEAYGVGFEFGREYLIFYLRTNRKIGEENFFYTFAAPYVYAPLGGEYPYIETFPGKTRYDATYFGAETKYVSKEEFIRLVSERNFVEFTQTH